MGHDVTENLSCSVICRNVAVVETKRLGASDCIRTQFKDVAETMYVKMGRGGTGLRGIQLSTNYGRQH